MAQSQTNIRRRLEQARATQSPVCVRRDKLDWDETTGFVVALTDDWVVLHNLDGVYLDEVVLLRLDLVTKIERSFFGDEYVLRAVNALGNPIESFGCAADASAADLLRIVEERAELVGVHLEGPDGDWINVGKIHRIGKNRLDLQFIGRDGVWVEFVEAWKLRDITRIEFGGRYISALERFGDPRPPVESRKKR